MRSQQRIPQLLKRLEKVWSKYPDFRLAQLIGNVYHVPSGEDPYYVEDEDFIENIEKYYSKSICPVKSSVATRGGEK